MMNKKVVKIILGLVLFGGESTFASWKMAEEIIPPEISMQSSAPSAMTLNVAPLAMDAAVSTNETAVTARIKALAHGLRHDPLAIYNYVRNEIDYEPGRGIYTGADGCLRIGKGNDWDQCALLIALLRESGVECRYVTGDVGYNRSDVSNWLGVETNQVDYLCVNFGMRAGGITGYDDKMFIQRCWVEANIDGNWKTLDPGFEQFDTAAPLNWASGSAYSLADFLSGVTNGATISNDYVENLNETSLAQKLREYTENLEEAIRQSTGSKNVDRLLFGRKKVKSELTTFSTSLPSVWYQWTPNSPVDHLADSDMLKLRIQHQGIDETLRADFFFGKSIVITYNPDEGFRPELFLNGELIATGSSCISNTAYSLTLSCDHPAYNAGQFDDSSSQDLICGGRYEVIGQFMGKISANLLNEESSRLSELRQNYAQDSVQVFGSSMRLMELYYFYQRQMSSRLRAHVAGVIPQNINQLGVCGEQNGGVFFDLPGSLSGSISKDGDASRQSIYYLSGAFMLSALEHGVLEQLQELTSVSTVRLLTRNNELGRKTYYADASNWSTIQGSLTNYSSGFLSSVGQNISAGYEYVLPERPDITLLEWTGTGYAEYGRYVQSTPVGMIISGGYYGGYGAEEGEYDPYLAYLNSLLSDSYTWEDIVATLSPEPVDLFTGNYVFDKTDLMIGAQLPLGIHFSRSYSSGQSVSAGVLGHGWSHSLSMRVILQSRPAESFEADNPEQLAEQMVQAMVTVDLMQNNPGALEWVAAAMTADWGMEQATENVATVSVEGKTHTFVQQADDSFTASGNGTASLVFTNDVFVFEERNGRTFLFDTNNLISSVTDPSGNEAQFSWSNGRLDSVSDEFGRQLTFNYTGERLTSVADSTGRAVSYEYDSNANLTNVTDAASHDWAITYDAEHRIKSLKDPEEITTIQNFYNEAGQVTNQISATGHPWNFYFAGTHSIEENPYGAETTTYFDASGRNLGTEDAQGNRTYALYDEYGRMTNSVTAAGITNLFVYDEYHNLRSMTEAAGHPEERTTVFTYDNLNRLQFITNALNQVTEYEYTAAHQVEQLTEAKGSANERVTDRTYYANGLLHTVAMSDRGITRTTTTTYDSNGLPNTVTSTDAGTVDYDYNARGDLILLTDQDLVKTRFYYDAERRLTNTVVNADTPSALSAGRTYYANGLLFTQTDLEGNATTNYWTAAYKPAGTVFPNGSSITNEYDFADRLVRSRDANLNWVTNTLDAIGRPVSVASTYSVMTNQFDSVGNLTNSVVDPETLSLQTRMAYDGLNRATDRWLPIGHESYQYDDLSQITNRFDAAVKSWKTSYDSLGRVQTGTRPSGATETWDFDAFGNRRIFWNAENKPVTFGYDAQGRVTAITNAIGNTTRFGYNPDGTLDWRINGELEQTDYQYDPLNRLTNVVHEGSWKASFAYTSNGQVKQSQNENVVVSFGYNEMNRLTASTQTVGSVSFVAQNQFDAAGYRTNIVYPGGLNVSYHYGADNRLESVTTEYSNDTKTVSFGYDTANRMNSISYPNGVNASFGLDDAGRITSVQHGTAVNRTIHRNSLGFKETECVDAGIQPSVPGTLRSIKTHNDADQLVSEQVQTGTTWADVMYSYSENGCLTNVSQASSPAEAYTYDYNNMLVSAGGAGSTPTEYLYDATGARIGRIHNSTTNYFVIDYTDGLKRPLAETDSTGNITRYYVWSGSMLLCHIEASGDVYFYHADELGSTLAITDANGSVTDQFAYMPYGYATRTGSTETPFQWLGGYGVYYDSEADLHLTLHRAYSSKIKRFIQPDPLGIDGGANVYAMANRNPLIFIDPYGLKTIASHGIWHPDAVDDMAQDLNADVFYWDGKLSTTIGEHLGDRDASTQFEEFILDVIKENPGEPIDLVLYSGSGQIGVNAAEMLADDGIEIRNMIFLGAPVDEWKIDNVQNIYNFYSGTDPLSWNVNINPDNPVTYQYFEGMKHYNPDDPSADWTGNQAVRDQIKNIVSPLK